MPGNEEESKLDHSYVRMAARGFVRMLLMIVFVFVLAGRITYWQGWVFSGMLIIIFGVSVFLFADKMDLIRERQRPGPGTKWWDRIFYALYIPAFLALFVVGCLDGGRFGWTGSLPPIVYVLGYIIYTVSTIIILWAMWTNRFFSSTVRIQTDRGQTVIQEGPYRFVRHPGYVGGILMGVGMSLILGSLWALIPAAVVTVLLVVRTCLEDATLKKELDGYAEYAKNVRYRLLPGVW